MYTSTHHTEKDGNEPGESNGAGGVDEADVDQDVGQVEEDEGTQKPKTQPGSIEVNYSQKEWQHIRKGRTRERKQSKSKAVGRPW